MTTVDKFTAAMRRTAEVGLQGSGRDQRDLRKVMAIATWLAREQWPAFDSRMSADEEVGQDSGARAASRAVLPKSLSSEEQRRTEGEEIPRQRRHAMWWSQTHRH